MVPVEDAVPPAAAGRGVPSAGTVHFPRAERPRRCEASPVRGVGRDPVAVGTRAVSAGEYERPPEDPGRGGQTRAGQFPSEIPHARGPGKARVRSR